MTRRVQLRWLIAAIVGILLAILVGFLLLPAAISQPVITDVVVMDDLKSTDVVVYRPAPAPVAAPQPVPQEREVRQNHDPDHWERVHDRADWVGGAVVTCDISSLKGDFFTAFIDFDKGLQNSGTVDIISRAFTPVRNDRITFTVTEESGEARISLMQRAEEPEPHSDGTPNQTQGMLTEARGVPARISWTGATPGSTVGCTSIKQTESAKIRISLVDETGQPAWPELNQHGFVDSLIVIRGCGLHFPMQINALTMSVEAGRCGLQVEHRNMTIPLIVTRSPVYLVNLQPGDDRTIHLELPDSPPLYQPPDMLEVSAAADIAAFFGADIVADKLEEALLKLASGDWDAEELQDLASDLERSRRQDDMEDYEDVVDVELEELDSQDSSP